LYNFARGSLLFLFCLHDWSDVVRLVVSPFNMTLLHGDPCLAI
jgi:hypothetical protein